VHYPGIMSTDMCICVWLCVPAVVAVNVVTSQCRSALCACLPNTAHTPPQTFRSTVQFLHSSAVPSAENTARSLSVAFGSCLICNHSFFMHNSSIAVSVRIHMPYLCVRERREQVREAHACGRVVMYMCVWLCVPAVVAANVLTSQCRSALGACLPSTAHTPPQTF